MLTRVLPPPGPARLITGITMVLTLGQGLWMAINAIYAVVILHLTPAQLGISVSSAAALVLICSTPLGYLADRAGPREVQVWAYLIATPLTAALVLVDGFVSYLVMTSIQAVAYRAGRSARKAMIAALIPAEDRVHLLAYVRAASNVSVSIGAGLAGLVLAVGSKPAYQAAVLFTAGCFLATALLTLLERHVPPVPAKKGFAFSVLRDRPFLAFTAVDGLLSSHAVLLDVILPLWVLHHTGAPRWMSAVILILNTILVVALQTRAARGADAPAAAAKASMQGAACVTVACAVFALSDGTGAVLACTVLLLGAAVHALGEVRQAAGSWGVAFSLAPDDAQGQYHGTHAMGIDLGKMIAPAIFAWLVLEYGAAGWIVLAVAFAVLGAVTPAVVAWGLRKDSERAEPGRITAAG